MIAALIVVVGLGGLAIPLKDLYVAFPTDSTASTDTSARKASDLISEAFGPGREAPLLAVVDARDVAEADRGAAFDPPKKARKHQPARPWASPV